MKLKKNIPHLLLTLTMVTSLSACSMQRDTTGSTSPTAVENSIEPANIIRRDIQTASYPSNWGTNGSYRAEVTALYDTFLSHQIKFAQAAEILYMEDPNHEESLETYQGHIENIKETLLTADTLSPPQNMVDYHMEMVDNAFIVIWVLNQFEDEFENGLDFATEKDQLIFEGLSTYYSGVSMDLLDSIKEIQNQFF